MKIVTKFAMFCIKSWVRFMFKPKAYFVDKKVQTNHLKKPCVIIANHTSTKDALFLMTILKGKKNVIVAKDWYEKKEFHWILAGEGTIPCDRFNLDTEWIQLARKNLEAGKSVIIFPEGKTRQDGELNEFKSGFAFLARYTGCPVVSIGIDGIYKFSHRTRYIVDVPEQVVRTKGVPSSKDLADKSEYFRLKCKALKQKVLEMK